jgi:tRNA pseudouridine55 synthase
VVARVRRALQTRSVGHAGTLDPFATGLLVVLVGRATRLARFVEQQDKTYWGEAVLGVTTDTDDGTGAVLAEMVPAAWPELEEIQRALASLAGSQLQRPPAYSARRVAGERGYRLARAGKPVDLPATPVTVSRLDLLAWAAPVVTFRAVVSAGTYVRALARDLGERLGTGAHLRALRRERIGELRVEDAVPLEQLNPGTPVLPPLAVLGHLARVPLTDAEAGLVRHGRPVAAPEARGFGAMLVEGRLVAVAEGGHGEWQPRVVLEPA